MWTLDPEYSSLKTFVYKHGGFVKIVSFWGVFFGGGGLIFLKVERKRWCLMFIISEKRGSLRESLTEYYTYVLPFPVYCTEIVPTTLAKARKNIYQTMLNDDNKIDDLMLIWCGISTNVHRIMVVIVMHSEPRWLVPGKGRGFVTKDFNPDISFCDQ